MVSLRSYGPAVLASREVSVRVVTKELGAGAACLSLLLTQVC